MTNNSSPHHQLLIVDDDFVTTELLRHYAHQHQFVPVVSSTFQEAVALDWRKFSAVLLDLELPDGEGFELLCQARKHHPGLPCFVITSTNTADSAVAALKTGALDYFTKPFDHARIFSAIRAALPRCAKSHQVETCAPHSWKSAGMVAAHDGLTAAARNDFPVLLTGAPGTERRNFAREIHSHGIRARRPFASVDVAGLDEVSLELELFGGESRHPPGSIIRRRGKIEAAHGGTLFIQDIDQMPIALQGRLIDALEADPRASDFRLIASSRGKLDAVLQRMQFRNDLFYRLSTHVIHLPRLNEVPEDIPVWCDRFLTEICLKQGSRRPQFTRSALEAMVDYRWPGNLDELRRTLEQIVIGAAQGLVGIKDLPSQIVNGTSPADPATLDLTRVVARMDDLERLSLIAALEACNGNRRRAAKRLGVSLRTIYNMIDRHALRDLPLKSLAQ